MLNSLIKCNTLFTKPRLWQRTSPECSRVALAQLRRAASITVPWVACLPTGGVRTANLCLCSTNRWSPLPSIILWDCRRRRDCTGSCLPHMLLPLLPWKCSMIQWFMLCIYLCISMSAWVHFTILHLTRENTKYSCVDAHANLHTCTGNAFTWSGLTRNSLSCDGFVHNPSQRLS